MIFNAENTPTETLAEGEERLPVLRTEGGVSGVRDYLSSFVRPLLVGYGQENLCASQSKGTLQVLLSFQGAFTAAFEPGNLRRLIGNAASCFDHMKLGTFGRPRNARAIQCRHRCLSGLRCKRDPVKE